MTHAAPPGLARLSAPASEPVTLQETKDFLRITHADDDARLIDLIAAARTLAEQWTRRSLITQSWKLTLADYLSGRVRLPMGPVQSITSVVSLTESGVSTTLAETAYALSADQSALVVDSAIISHRIEISYVAGYGTSSQVPKPIKLGILAHIAHLYDGTISLAPLPDEVMALYTPYREVML